MSTIARVAYIRTAVRHDVLGEKVVFTGVPEDSKSKVSFVSHKISYPLIRDSVYNIYSAYVYEFPDRSLLLVITEFTKLEPKNVEDIREYTWVPKIGDIIRPVRYINLNGTVSTIHSTSGLIKRCNKCRSLILHDATKCPNECGMGYAWRSSCISQLLRWVWLYQNGLDKRSCCQSITAELEPTYLECFIESEQPTRSNSTK